jgi:hypothetical protein
MYDILQSRKPRATGGELWGFRFRPGFRLAHRLVGRRSAVWNVAVAGEVQRRCCPGSGLEVVAGAMGEVASASGIVAGSTRLSERNLVEPCRVMAR